MTDAIYGAGYGSSSRFYESSAEVLGMTPTSFQNGGADVAIHFAIGECSLGSILVAKSDRGVCAVLLGPDAEKLVRDLQEGLADARAGRVFSAGQVAADLAARRIADE